MKKRILMTWLLLLVSSAMVMVLAQDDFTPTNPPEPNLFLKVTVKSENGNVSGGGRYLSGPR